jgi:hypothetical protein
MARVKYLFANFGSDHPAIIEALAADLEQGITTTPASPPLGSDTVTVIDIHKHPLSHPSLETMALSLELPGALA